MLLYYMDNPISEEQNSPSLRSPVDLFLSMLGIGLVPKMPGTAASFASALILYLVSLTHVAHFLLLPFLIITFAGSSFIAHSRVGHLNKPDRPWIVIDEFIGMLATWIIAAPVTPLAHFFIFLLFRLFDIWKPWPIHIIDEKWDHGLAIMLDDLVAGIYAGVVYLILWRVYA